MTGSTYHRAGRSAAEHDRAAQASFRALEVLCSSAPTPDRQPEEWRLREELSIAGWRTSLHQEAFAACDDLALGRGIPDRIVDDARGHLLYYAEPTKSGTFRRIDAPIGASRNVQLPIESRVNASNWLGEADPIRSPLRPDGWMVLVREEVLLKRSQRQWQPVDLHRFAEYDDRFELARVSRPFTFLHWGLEAVAGLSSDNDDVIVTFRVEDERAYECRMPLARVDEMLNARVLPSPNHHN